MNIQLVTAILVLGTADLGARPASQSADALVHFKGLGCEERFTERLECPPTSPIGRAGCDRLFPDDALAAFGTAAVCWKFGDRGERDAESIRVEWGFLPIYVRLVVATSSGFEVISTGESLRQRFAPVESPAEARGFAAISTGYEAAGAFTPPAGFRVFVSEVPATTVDPTPDGFPVRNLRDYQSNGCGPHPTDLVDVSVSKDGHVAVARRTRAYEDPSEDDLCVN